MRHELRVFLGYDSKEPIAFHVAMHSLMRHASHPISITPLIQSQLRRAGMYTRERGNTESTEFSMTRFLVPYLSNYEGYSLFMDCDVVVKADVWELMTYALAYPEKAVFCTQHDYTPKSTRKFNGNTQTAYPRKNWSSVMLFNNERCKALTPNYVNAATGLELHRFQWLKDEQIGELPLEWNHLVGEYDYNADAKLLHYTNGSPCFPEYADCDHATDWLKEYEAMEGSYTPGLVTK